MNSKKNEELDPKNQDSKEEIKQTNQDSLDCSESYQIAATQNMRIPHLENYNHIRN